MPPLESLVMGELNARPRSPEPLQRFKHNPFQFARTSDFF